MEKLKPCPFCGSEKVKVFAYADGGICIKCLNCYCQTQTTSDFCISDAEKECAYERCVKAWNRRISDG